MATTSESALRARPTGTQSAIDYLLMQAKAAIDDEQPEAAERLLTDVLSQAPDNAQANRLMGIVQQLCGRNTQACAYLRHALALSPDDPVIQMNLGSALCESGALDEAIPLLRRACQFSPDKAGPWYNLGRALKMQIQFEPARAALERALAIDPAHPKARIALAHAQTSLGDIPGAVANFREVLRYWPNNARAWFALANMKTYRFDAADAARLDQALREPNLDDYARVHLGFALAKALEDQGDYRGAFAALREANQCQRRNTPWDAAAARAQVDAIMAAFDQPAALPTDTALGHEVILIACLPRSGSTLTEQILASHPEVEGANEIPDLPAVIDGESKRRGQPFPDWTNAATDADWARLGREYLVRTERWRRQRPRFTDKSLLNWQLIGAALRMLPGAKVVNCRRDPLETCFSCYRQLFSNGNGFTYDMDDMVDHYVDYHRLTHHWLRVFPQQVLDHEYEALLADPERQTRRLLEFCGLTFDRTCLDFHRTARTVLSTASAAQVRQPLHADAPHSSRYRDELAPTRERLRAAGLL